MEHGDLSCSRHIRLTLQLLLLWELLKQCRMQKLMGIVESVQPIMVNEPSPQRINSDFRLVKDRCHYCNLFRG